MIVMGLDIPTDRPDTDGRAALFVPAVGAKEAVLLTIRKGAAVVGFFNHDSTLTLYYESNRFGDTALAKWDQKARKAYDRLTENAPTVSKMVSSIDNFEQIGSITGKGLTIRRMESLQRWLEQSDALDSLPDSDNVARAAGPKADAVKP